MPFDIGIGIILGLLLSPFDSNTAANVAVGITFTLLPDFDAIIYFASKVTGIGKVEKRVKDHREILHYPLPFIVIGIIIVAMIKADLVAIFVLGSIAHFAHDSIGIGWGIPWLHPFNKLRYKFLYQYDLRRAGLPQKLLWIWTKNEQDKLIAKYGDPNWHKHAFQFWKHATLWRTMEITVLVISMTILFSHSS